MQKVLIVGGGFFGMYLAEHLSRKGCAVRLVEKEKSFMSRASYNNQARVHNGYHYPRSILTALRSRVSFPRFVAEFKDCIDSDFETYYLIGRLLGKISARQFQTFCERIGAPCEQGNDRIKSLTNPGLIEDCFKVVEYAFDSDKLRNAMLARLSATRVLCSLGFSVESIAQQGSRLRAEIHSPAAGEKEFISVDHIFNCTYSRINYLVSNSCLEPVPLRHELTEVCLVEVPEHLRSIGITVMCGPFFSVMPFPPAGLHSFSHVRYTPHFTWQDSKEHNYTDADIRYRMACRSSAWKYMQKDAMRYMPILCECVYKYSNWEVKTVLPRSEADDSRPILFRPNHGLEGFHCIMGGKLDNVYDVLDAVDSQGLLDGHS